MSATEFAPDQPITREQAAKMITNYKRISDTYHDRLNRYNDSWQVSNWAKDAVLEAGYMNGYSEDNTYRPLNNITRAGAVVTLSRVESNPNPVIPTPPAPEPPVVDRTVYANSGSSSSNKYHKSYNSHGMKEAIKMSESEAKRKAYVPCGSCF